MSRQKRWSFLGIVLEISLAGFGSLFSSPVVEAASAAVQPSRSPVHALGSAPCIWAIPLQGADKALDVATTIRVLQENHFNCIAKVIENGSPNSFEEFKKLLSAAQAAGISVWPVLIPPSEGADSLPYRTDYVAWMKEMAKLSLQYSALRGVNIDDMFDGISAKTFTRDYLEQIYQAKQKINPQLLFMPTVYDLDQDVVDRLAGCVDGVWLWWTNLEHNAGMRTVLANSRVIVANRFPIYAGVYGYQTSWHTQAAPDPKVLRSALTKGCTYGDGAIIWSLDLSPTTTSKELLATAREFAPGGSSDLAGRCGLASTHSLK